VPKLMTGLRDGYRKIQGASKFSWIKQGIKYGNPTIC
jgi:hypothetical protein